MNGLSGMSGEFAVKSIDGVLAERDLRKASATRSASCILLAEDDIEMRRLLAECLREAGYEVLNAENGRRVLEILGAAQRALPPRRIDLVISDVRMPGLDGLRLLPILRNHDPDLPVILITAFGRAEVHAEGKLGGALAVIDKPFSSDQLLELVEHVLRICGILAQRRGPAIKEKMRGNDVCNS